MRDYPELEEKAASGALSLLKAELLGKVFREGTHRKEEWMEFAAAVTVRELSSEVGRYMRGAGGDPRKRWSYCPGKMNITSVSTCAHEKAVPGERENREGEDLPVVIKAADVVSICASEKAGDQGDRELTVHLSLPIAGSLIPLYRKALVFYYAHCFINRKEPSQPHFLEMLIEHFLQVHDRKKRATQRTRILDRDGWRCQAPGCSSRKNLEIHHIIFRCHGGSDDDGNLLTLCADHHLQGVHGGYLIIKGAFTRDLPFSSQEQKSEAV